MENITNEIKAKVFAQYLGQTAITTKKSYINPEVGILQQIDIKDDDHQIVIQPKEGGYYLCSINECKLILKPVSRITDEDAIEISNMFLTDENLLQSKIEFGKGVAYHYEVGSYYTSRPIEIYQFLQSKGYDLPQYLLNGKTLFECGLAIYE